MYLISIYFDEKTNQKIGQYIKQVAEKSGNRFMLEGNVPPHITISSFETRQELEAIHCLEKCAEKLKQGTLQWASVGVFLPYVIYLAPVLNEYLHTMSVEIYSSMEKIEDISISPYYRPFQWMPHTTIGKKLTKEEMLASFHLLQNQFGYFEGTVTKIGLAKTNPYEDLVTYDLKMR